MTKAEDRQALVTELRKLADQIEDPASQIERCETNAKYGIAAGHKPGGSYVEYRRNGWCTHSIRVEIYRPAMDEAQEDGRWWRLDPSADECLSRVPWSD